MGAIAATPKSGHHQAVDHVGEGLNIAAVAPDGVIEGLEMLDHPWAVGVQWHPELTAAQDQTQQRLFDALVRAAESR
jgi:putative glutamine amidotransferase